MARPLTRLSVCELETRLTPAVTVPPEFQLVPFATGMGFLTAINVAPDGRIFAAQKDGNLRVIENGDLLDAPAISLDVDTYFDRGLLGVAFDPDFAANGYVYLYYSTPVSAGDAYSVVSRFTMTGNVADPASEKELLRIRTPYAAHVAGMLQFGPDGKLYVAMGDNGQQEECQRIDNLYGKILRLNADGSIPEDNPFYDTAAGVNRAIYALGFRNPFSFAFEPGTGRLFVNDVGQDIWEEIDVVTAGGNYGWPRREGPTGQTGAQFIDPVFVYPHPAENAPAEEGEGNAIVSGAFYTPAVPTYPAEYVGKYFFMDLNGGWIRTLDPATYETKPFLQGFGDGTTSTAMIGMVVTPGGELLFYGSAKNDEGVNEQAVYKLVFTRPLSPPALSLQPAGQSVSVDTAVTFRASATGSGSLSYQWQRNEEDIPGATGTTYTLPAAALSDDGAVFRVVVSNADGSATSRPATLRVRENAAPTAVILTPTPDATFGLNRTITFSGRGTDPEEGALPASAYKWEVFFVTGGVARPSYTQNGGAEGRVPLPETSVYSDVDVTLRITLTVTDSRGAKSSASVELQPEVARLSITTNIPGLAATTLGGQPFVGETNGLVGFVRSVGADPVVVTAAGERYRFVGWADGGPAARSVPTPAEGFSLVARYRRDNPIVVGNGPGGVPQVRVQQTDTKGEQTFEAFEAEFTGGVRVATGDVTGDGTPDVIAAAGPGGGPRVRVFDGATLAEIANFFAFEPEFTGGVLLAVADLNGDGTDDLILSPDVGGGPRVRVLAGGNPDAVLADFFGLDDPNYRGGLSVAAGDLSGDGVPDLAAVAVTDASRVSVLDGARLLAGGWATPPTLAPDFYAFGADFPGGAFAALGDVNGDGVPDLALTPGPGGGPRVLVLDGRDLARGSAEPGVLANAFADDPESRTGLRVAVKDVDGSGTPQLVVSNPGAAAVQLRALTLAELSSEAGPTTAVTVGGTFDGTWSGVYVG